MILQALYNLAEREGLTAYLHWQPRRISWVIRVGKGGKFLGIEDWRRVPEGKRKPRGVTKLVPRQEIRTSGDKAHFLCDKAEYTLGIDPEGERGEERLRKRQKLFVAEIEDCLNSTGDAGVEAVYSFLKSEASRGEHIELPDDCASNDMFAFVYGPDIDRFVHQRPRVKEYWKQRRLTPPAGEPAGRCLITGSPVYEPSLFPQIKNVPGQNTGSGVSLVSFNNPSFESYGWSGNENAPISKAAAQVCGTALNRLLDPEYPAPDDPQEALPRRSLRISADTAVCYWSSDDSGDEFCSVLAPLLEADPESVRELYRSIWSGTEPQIKDPSAFYALTLSGQQGRIIVRDWFESTVGDVAGNLARHFSDLAVCTNSPAFRHRDEVPHFPLPLLMESLATLGQRDQVPAHRAARFARAALGGTRYPFSILQRAVSRVRAEIGKRNDERIGWNVKKWNDARAALIKAVLNRRRQVHPQTITYPEVQNTMDPNNRNAGYDLGRLMAVLERLQQLALDDVNASVVDRYFSGASASPKSVFVRLMKNARHHARKARDDDKNAGLAYRLERLMDEICDRFEPESDGFPAHLNLEEQGLFVLGYHQMRHWLWMDSEERKAWEQDHDDAPAPYKWKNVD